MEGSNEERKEETDLQVLVAQLRTELYDVRTERDTLVGQQYESERVLSFVQTKVEKLEQERTQWKTEKVVADRQRRTTQTLLDQLLQDQPQQQQQHEPRGGGRGNGGDGSTGNRNYYQQKCNELESRVQGLQARITFKNQELEAVKHDRDRNLSQNRLEALKKHHLEQQQQQHNDTAATSFSGAGTNNKGNKAKTKNRSRHTTIGGIRGSSSSSSNNGHKKPRHSL